MDRDEELRLNLAGIEQQISEACLRSGRDRSEVTLIAVSKTKPLSDILTVSELGQVCFGENRVQELLPKIDGSKGKNISWHLIGHLQTNKVRQIVGKTDMIHSVDSYKLAECINAESAKLGIVSDILMEINIGSEESKFGVTCDEAYILAKQIGTLKNVHLCGLMTVAPIVSEPEQTRPFFRRMRELFIDINSKNYDNVNMNVLSMGMSHDFCVAIEEGATMVRVGTGIFGARIYNI